MNSNEVRVALATALRNTTLTQFGKRLQNALSTTLGHNVVCHKGEYQSYINVWHGNAATSVTIHHMSDAFPTDWKAKFLENLDRDNTSDYEERERDEEMIVLCVYAIEQKIEALRAEAYNLIEALPVPASAPACRADSPSWGRPSKALSDRFPLTFGGK